MQMTRLLLALSTSFVLAASGCSAGGSATGSPSGTGGKTGTGGGQAGSSGGAAGTGGATGNGGAVGTGGASGSAGATGTGGSTSAGGANGTGGSSAAGGAAATGGDTSRGGATGAGGTGPGGATATGGSVGTGGATSAGSGGARTGGTTATGTGGSTGAVGTGGSTATGVTVSASCKIPTWPTPTGSTVTISGTKSVTNYDGGGALHEGNLNDCTKGDQSSTNAIIEVANGGSVKNVIFGKNVGDGIHCLGSCTIDNVWFPYICDDAITINRDGTASATSTISNSGFKGARDKIIQHNGGDSSLNITNVYAEVGGKLYRSCGKGGGCTTGSKHTVNVSNVVAIGLMQVVGVNTTDTATLSNICTFRTSTICNTYVSTATTETDATTGANGTSEGPSPSCKYTAADTHALVDHVGGPTLTTDVVCAGPNSSKSGSTATACVTGFETCLKNCAPGMYGLQQLSCSGGKYTSAATGGCALVTAAADSAAATNLAGTRAATATTSVTKNNSCTTEWALGKDSATATNTCECVEKPGYYQQSTGSAQPVSWMVWDCQSQWW